MTPDTVFVAASAAGAAPSAWQLIVAIAAVASFMAALVAFGIAYGKVTSRIEALEKSQGTSAKHAETTVMFEDIKRRLERIEDHFDREKA